MEFTQEKIKAAFEKANPKIKEILLDEQIIQDISLIGKKAGLRIDRIDGLIRIVGYVVLNLIPLSQFVEVIHREIGLDEEKALEVASKVDEFVFTKIRQKMVEKESEDSQKKESTPDNTEESAGVLRSSLIKDLEDHAQEFGEPAEGQSFAEMFERNKTTVTDVKNTDVYREDF